MNRFFYFVWCSLIFITASCSKQETQKKSATIAMNENFTTADPRQARSLNTINLIKNIYEGLTSTDITGNVHNALAKTISISSNKKEYRITLHKAHWSDGHPITAYDFEYSWKSSLKPSCKAPNAYQLFIIKNAKAIYEGKKNPTELGIHITDDYTFIITLETPSPSFLERLSTHPFFPVAKHAFKEYEELSPLQTPTNGPFFITEWKPNSHFCIEKNNYFRNAKQIHMQKIIFSVLNGEVAFQNFKKGLIDWIGSPLSTLTTASLTTLRKEHQIFSVKGAATQFARLNVEKNNQNPFLANAKFRKALAYACDRTTLVEDLQSNYVPARSFIPPIMGNETNYFAAQDFEAAKKLYQEAIDDLKSRPVPISLLFINAEKNSRIAEHIQRSLKEVLNLDCFLEPSEPTLFYEHLKKRQYTLALGSWSADLSDPTSYLGIFQYKENGTNNTYWENARYSHLIEESSNCNDPATRTQLLNDAQKILMDEMPIIPLFHLSYNYAQSERLHNVKLSPFGILDLSEATIE